MDPDDRKTIRRNMVALTDDMDFDIVSTALIARFIFDTHHIEKFQAKPSRKMKNQALLMEIQSRGPTAFKSLIECLVEADQVFLANQLGYSASGHSQGHLVQASTPHDNKPNPFGQPTQQPGPVNAHQWPAPGSSGDYSSVQMDAATSYPTSMTDSDSVYKMKSKPRGIALIINNKKFTTMKQRSGTDVDCRNLENVFKQLGFNVMVHRDLKGREIQQILTQLSRHNHSQFDGFILTILSHGIEGAIYGTDEYLVKIDDLIGYFSSDRCPTLSGKPKLFFLQACRGERFDAGVEATDGRSVGPEGDQGDQATQAAQAAQPDIPEAELVKKMLELELDSTDSFASAKSKMPSQSDMLLAYATVPGYVSWRNSERGSWFIQALCEVIVEHSRQEDLLSMITMVNGRVARAFESSSGRHKQMPAPVTMLTKKLFFFPGLYD